MQDWVAHLVTTWANHVAVAVVAVGVAKGGGYALGHIPQWAQWSVVEEALRAMVAVPPLDSLGCPSDLSCSTVLSPSAQGPKGSALQPPLVSISFSLVTLRYIIYIYHHVASEQPKVFMLIFFKLKLCWELSCHYFGWFFNVNFLFDVNASTDKLTIEPERDADSLGVFTEGTGETTSWSSIKRHTTTSNRSRIGSRRGSVGSRGTARAESCSSEPVRFCFEVQKAGLLIV